MVFDPFTQIVKPAPPVPTTITEYLPYKPNLLFGVDEKIVVGIIMGVLLLNFIQCITEH